MKMSRGGADLEEMQRAAPAADRRVADVSGWSIGMHIHHSVLVMIGISRSLITSSPPPPRSRFNTARWIVLLSGRIPRGRGQAPGEVVPQEDQSPEDLAVHLGKARRWVARAEGLNPDAWYKHFAFGILQRDQALRLIRIHNNHHLRIIRNILAA